MRNRRRFTLAAILLLTVFAWTLALAGCQPQTGAGPATRPSLATLATQADSALQAAVNSITLGRQLDLIPDEEFNGYIVPAVRAARAATLQMEAAAEKGDQSGFDVAQNATTAALAQLQPVLARVQAEQAKGAK